MCIDLRVAVLMFVSAYYQELEVEHKTKDKNSADAEAFIDVAQRTAFPAC